MHAYSIVPPMQWKTNKVSSKLTKESPFSYEITFRLLYETILIATSLLFLVALWPMDNTDMKTMRSMILEVMVNYRGDFDLRSPGSG